YEMSAYDPKQTFGFQWVGLVTIAHGDFRNEAVEIAEYVQKPACLLRVLRVGQLTRGTLRLEGFVNAVQAFHCATQWADAASSRFEGGSNSPVQFGRYAAAHDSRPTAMAMTKSRLKNPTQISTFAAQSPASSARSALTPRTASRFIVLAPV
ncbi:MAG: hypothetical protein WCF47_00170, partial [Pseudolabrys sp.]